MQQQPLDHWHLDTSHVTLKKIKTIFFIAQLTWVTFQLHHINYTLPSQTLPTPCVALKLCGIVDSRHTHSLSPWQHCRYASAWPEATTRRRRWTSNRPPSSSTHAPTSARKYRKLLMATVSSIVTSLQAAVILPVGVEWIAAVLIHSLSSALERCPRETCSFAFSAGVTQLAAQ